MKKFLMPFCALLVAGCSSSNEEFDCPYGVGMACKSMSHVEEVLDGQDALLFKTSDPDIYLVQQEDPLFLGIY